MEGTQVLDKNGAIIVLLSHGSGRLLEFHIPGRSKVKKEGVRPFPSFSGDFSEVPHGALFAFHWPGYMVTATFERGQEMPFG